MFRCIIFTFVIGFSLPKGPWCSCRTNWSQLGLPMCRHTHGFCITLYLPIVYILYICRVVEVPGALMFVPSSSDELHQRQGLDSADLQEELWIQRTARNSSRLRKLWFSYRTWFQSYCSCWREEGLLGSAAQKAGWGTLPLPPPPANPHFFKAKMLF